MTAIRRPRWWFQLRSFRRWWVDQSEVRMEVVNAALFLLLIAAICYRLLTLEPVGEVGP